LAAIAASVDPFAAVQSFSEEEGLGGMGGPNPCSLLRLETKESERENERKREERFTFEKDFG